MKVNEFPIVFGCGADEMVSIIHQPEQANSRGVLIIVGGPQYRVGSHRQFLLLARVLASNNFPVMRFDYRGMGDSSGDLRSFEEVGEDIRAAIDVFFQKSPGLQEVVLWGLCDAASAALFYAHTDPRVRKLILLNPWVRTEEGEAKTILRHYYIKRLLDKELWKKIFCGNFSIKASMCSLLGLLRAAESGVKKDGEGLVSRDVEALSLPERMLNGIRNFEGRIGIILSGNDLTADEFRDLIASSGEWSQIIESKSVQFKYIDDANHTFSQKEWRDKAAEYSLAMIR